MAGLSEKRAFEFKGDDHQYQKYLEDHLMDTVFQLRPGGFQLQPLVLRSPDTRKRKRDEVPVGGMIQYPNQPEARVKTQQEPQSRATTIWMSEINELLNDIGSVDWLARREELGMATTTQAGEVLLYIISAIPCPGHREAAVHSRVRNGDDRWKVVLRQYAELAAEREKQAQIAQQVSRYSTFLLHCLCLVLLHRGMTVQDVDDRLREAFPEVTSMYLARLRRTARWLCSLIARLESRLHCRAAELFLLYGKELWRYKKCADSAKQSSDIVHSKIVDATVASHEPCRTEERISASPAFLIMYLGAGEFRLSDVNKALQTKAVESDYVKWAGKMDALKRQAPEVSLDDWQSPSGAFAHVPVEQPAAPDTSYNNPVDNHPALHGGSMCTATYGDAPYMFQPGMLAMGQAMDTNVDSTKDWFTMDVLADRPGQI